LLPLTEEQLAVVASDALDRIAAIHGSATLTVPPPLFFGGIGREDEMARISAEREEKAGPELMRGPKVQDTWNADPELTARRRGALIGGHGTRAREPCRQHWDTHACPP